jgi:GNAT superfamily N-acetyltransferase
MKRRSDIDLLLRNLQEMLTAIARSQPGGEAVEQHGVFHFSTGFRHSLANIALILRPVTSCEDFRHLLSTSAQFFVERDLPFCWQLCRDMLPADVPRLGARSFDITLMEESPGMFAQRLAVPSRALPHVDIRLVREPRDFAQYADLMCSIFHLSPPFATAVYGSEQLWSYAGLRGFLATANGVTFGLAATLEAAGAQGVYSVGILPNFRHRGYAEALMRAITGCGQKLPSVLQATPSGLELYRRLGYQEFTGIRLYVPCSPHL